MAFVGIKINGGPNTQKALQTYGKNLIIGELILFTSVTLTKIVFKIFLP